MESILEPDFTTTATNKLVNLQVTYPDLKCGGMFLRRPNGDAVIITNEGRIEWFKQNNLGGIKQRVVEDDDVFGNSIINRSRR